MAKAISCDHFVQITPAGWLCYKGDNQKNEKGTNNTHAIQDFNVKTLYKKERENHMHQPKKKLTI
jgi:hypothetical protein